MQLSTHCRACGTINISIYVNNFLNTNPTTLILSSLEVNFDEESNSEKKLLISFLFIFIYFIFFYYYHFIIYIFIILILFLLI